MLTSIYLGSIILFIFFVPSNLKFFKNETALISSLLKNMGVHNCIFVENKKEEINIWSSKKFSSEALSTAYFNYNQVMELVENGLNKYDISSVQTRTVIIFREENLSIIENILENFSYRNKTTQMHFFTWLAVIENYHSTIQPHEKDLILYDCEFIIVNPYNLTTYNLKEIYMVKQKSFSNDLGFWDVNQGLKMTDLPLYHRRLNLNQSAITLAVDDDLVSIQVYQIFQCFADMMNIKFIPFLRDIVALMKLGPEAESIALPLDSSMFKQLNSEYKAHYPIGPMVKTTINWYIKYPREEKLPDYYIQPFELDLWLGVVFSVTIGIIVTTTIHVLSKNYPKNSFIDDVFMSFDCYFNQNGCKFIRYIPSRMVCIVMRLSSLVIVASYLAIITSCLTFEIKSLPFQTKEEMVERGFKLALDDVFVLVFLETKLNSIKGLEWFKNLDLNDLRNSSLPRICNETIVYVDFNYDVYGKNPACEIMSMKDPFETAKVYLALQAHEHFKKAFDQNLIRIYESGIQNRMQKIIDTPPLHTIQEIEDGFDPVELKQMVQVMLIPVFGVAFAGAIYMFEILHDFMGKRKRNYKIISLKKLSIFGKRWNEMDDVRESIGLNDA